MRSNMATNSRFRAFLALLVLVSISIVLEYKYQGVTSAITNMQAAGTTESNEVTYTTARFQKFLPYSRIYKVAEVDCAAVFSGVTNEVKKAVKVTKQLRGKEESVLTRDFYLKETKNCSSFLAKRGYITDSISVEEENFPLAFSLLVYTDLEMLERLLRSIYRPQNHYCVHVDKKSSEQYFEAVKAIVDCLPNVFLASKRVDVKWGKYSVLEPELICMEALFRRKFKYFINLTGQEFPLKTNLELVRILKALKGANDVYGSLNKQFNDRWRGKPPHGVQPIKGAVHVTVNRDFVDYILHNATGKDILEWVSQNASIPDEALFPTLNHNPQLGIPGTYRGALGQDMCMKPALSRFKNWGSSPCAGYLVRGICILSTGDLPTIGSSLRFFANKFHLQEDPIAVGCLEEKLFNDTRDEYLGLKDINTGYYSVLNTVRLQVLPP